MVKIIQKFTEHNWMISDTYNNIIKGFGQRFDDFTVRELAMFVSSFAKVGLRQNDVIDSCIEQIETKAALKEERDRILSSFHGVIFPVFKAVVDLNLQDQLKNFN